MTVKTNGKVPEEVIDAYRAKLDNLFPGEKKERSETETNVLCSVHEADGKDHTPSLGADLVENGRGFKILLNCRSKECDYKEILKAAGITQDDLYIPLEAPEGCSVGQYARHKGLDEDYLKGDEVGLQDDTYAGKPAVRIPYFDEDGKYLDKHDRWRVSLKKTEKGHPIRGLSKKYGGKITLYGRWWLPDAREAGYVLVCEGESDCHSAWSMGWIAVGVPGIQNWRDQWAAFFDGIAKIYVVVEDDAGEKLFEKIFACEGLKPRLYKVAL